MKKIFTLIILLSALQSNGQGKIIGKMFDNNGGDTTIIYADGSRRMVSPIKSDTLFLSLYLYKFIKIGDRVYKIESSMLVEVMRSDTTFINNKEYFWPGIINTLKNKQI